MASEWGRKETIVWPPHSPVNSIGAVFAALVCTLFFVWQGFRSETLLRRTYMPDYIESQVGALFHHSGRYRLIYVGGGKRSPRYALPFDFVEEGQTTLTDGRIVPVTLSELAVSEGYRTFYAAAPKVYTDASMHRWLRAAIFDGQGIIRTYAISLSEGLFVLVLFLALAIPRDIQRFRILKYGRRLKGPVMLTPKQFNKEVRGDGIGFRTSNMKDRMRIPARNEAQHFQLIGDTGTGKTTLISQILTQISDRGHSAIVYDPACEYIQRFYDEERGDIVLNPLDARCPYWGPAQEMRKNAEADAIAESLYAPTSDSKDEFFHQTPAQIFAHLLKQGPTPHELAAWMANAKEIEQRVKGTEMEHYIGMKAGPQRAGVLSSLGLVAKSLRLLPTLEQAGGRTWSANKWSEERKGWIFITSRPNERVALRPLHSLWIDLLVMRLLSRPRMGQRPVWFVIDELASLQQLPKLHTAITENRKSQNPLVLGFQGKAQLEVIYGHLAEVMLSQPATKIFLRTTEPKAAEWVSKAIGNIEIERLKETKHDGARSGKNFTVDRQIEPLVMDSEIEGLGDRHAYLKLGNNVARFSFLYMDMPQHTTDFIPRVNEEDELSFDPETLAAKQPRTESRPQPVDEGPSASLPPEVPVPANLTEAAATTPVPIAAPVAADTTPQQQLAPRAKEERATSAVSQDLPDALNEEGRQIEEEDEEELEHEVSRVRGSL
jgi:type IV secretory pathway TraG/TraD family ATPase VirD4